MSEGEHGLHIDGTTDMIEVRPGHYIEGEQFEREVNDINCALRNILDFIATHNIRNIVLLDRSARLLGLILKHALRENEDSSDINIYHLDHNRFIPADVARALGATQQSKTVKGSLGKNRINEDMEAAHPHLMKRKNEGTLVLDEYVLNAVAATSVRNALQKIGFRNLYCGGVFVHEGDGENKIDVAGEVRNNPPFFYNSEFNGVEHVKGRLSVLSEALSDDLHARKARALREKILDVLKKSGNSEEA